MHSNSDASPIAKSCDTTGVISYSAQVAPLLNANCNNCHNTGGTAPNLSNYNGVLNSAQNTLYSSVAWDGNASNMPKGLSKMSDCDVAIIKKWVFAGAPNN
ncbi:MAG: cytochrome c [Bacteroidetes bacterium]|nr:cytochrome c [Bacteroidota bacterium]